mmetsp:Transcript_68381/g.209704  ORF Transcript_68381/g.209704 Transcript_68381/m.209704 type:complete len:340 (+) Transcript_68381:1049-2068(+)
MAFCNVLEYSGNLSSARSNCAWACACDSSSADCSALSANCCTSAGNPWIWLTTSLLEASPQLRSWQRSSIRRRTTRFASATLISNEFHTLSGMLSTISTALSTRGCPGCARGRIWSRNSWMLSWTSWNTLLPLTCKISSTCSGSSWITWRACCRLCCFNLSWMWFIRLRIWAANSPRVVPCGNSLQETRARDTTSVAASKPLSALEHAAFDASAALAPARGRLPPGGTSPEAQAPLEDVTSASERPASERPSSRSRALKASSDAPGLSPSRLLPASWTLHKDDSLSDKLSANSRLASSNTTLMPALYASLKSGSLRVPPRSALGSLTSMNVPRTRMLCE